MRTREVSDENYLREIGRRVTKAEEKSGKYKVLLEESEKDVNKLKILLETEKGKRNGM